MILFRRRFDRSTQSKLRPQSWEEFVGHKREVYLICSALAAAHKRKEAPPHILLWGPSGCGKTSLAKLVQAERKDGFTLSGPALEPAELAACLLNAKRGVVLIDEIHALHPRAQQVLFPVLEENILYWGRQSREVHLSVIGTALELGKVKRALRNRFGMEIYIGAYNKKEIAKIVAQTAKRLEIAITNPACAEAADWARGNPRLALRIFLRSRDVASKKVSDGKVGKAVVRQAVEDLGFDRDGLLPQEREYLLRLVKLGGETGIANLAAALQQDRESVRLIEPYLLSEGYLEVSSRGRRLTLKGLELFQADSSEEEAKT